QWDERKKEEGKYDNSILEGIPRALPALLRAYRVQKRAASVGFDWQKVEDVITKLDEEIQEFKDALKNWNALKSETASSSQIFIEDEFGDLLFTLVNISRHISVQPENALTRATNKFIGRFKHIEKKAKEMGCELASLSLNEMDSLWEEAKALEYNHNSDSVELK
ncbi:nucleoside triphosphate pyrophosphohydrolase, partial [Candidatus Magnetoovum chiemensis]